MPAETPGVRKHVLASANIFLGASNFIVIALPERYAVGQTINPAEVAGTQQARGAAWVLDGRCSHYLREAGSAGALELLVLSERGEARMPKWAGAPGVVARRFAEHEGGQLEDTIRVGLTRRRTMPRLRAWWSCERTKRTLQVELVGPAGSDLSTIGDTLLLSECH